MAAGVDPLAVRETELEQPLPPRASGSGESHKYGRREEWGVRALALLALLFFAWSASGIEGDGAGATAARVVLGLLAVLALAVFVAGRIFVVQASSAGLRLNRLVGHTDLPWEEIETFTVGPGWLSRFTRVFVVSRSGAMLPLRPYERHAERDSSVTEFREALQQELDLARDRAPRRRAGRIRPAH